MYARSLDDDMNSLGALIPTDLAPLGMRSEPPTTTTQPDVAPPPPMPTDVFTPLPGQVKKRCCADHGRATVINLNVNAGNNNGNGNGNGNGNAQSSAPRPSSASGTASGQRAYADQQEQYPAETVRIVERPVYKPFYIVREKIKKMMTYQPMQQVYERRVGKVYDDRPMSFEGKPVQSNIMPKSTATP